MKIEVITTPTFDREYKRLKKKYNSLPGDLLLFEKELTQNANIGVDLGGNIRKVRISIKSKSKGKSGGARVITYTAIVSVSEKTILLVTIYDKSEVDTISDDEIKQIIHKSGFWQQNWSIISVKKTG